MRCSVNALIKQSALQCDGISALCFAGEAAAIAAAALVWLLLKLLSYFVRVNCDCQDDLRQACDQQHMIISTLTVKVKAGLDQSLKWSGTFYSVT